MSKNQIRREEMNFQYIPKEGDICTYNGTGSKYENSTYNGFRLECTDTTFSRDGTFVQAKFKVISPRRKRGTTIFLRSDEVFWTLHRPNTIRENLKAE